MPLLAVILLAAALLAAMLFVVMREEIALKRTLTPRGTVEAVWDGQNRRRSPRELLSRPVRYRLYPSNTGEIAAQAHVWDTGTGGIAVRLPERLAPGAWLELEIVADDHARIQAKGEVRWTRELPRAHGLKPREFLTGVQFRDVTHAAIMQLMAMAQQQKESA